MAAEGAKSEKSDTGVDAKYITNRQGKDFVLYPGLVDLAHRRGLLGIKTTIIQIPCADNGMVAVVHARALMPQGSWDGLGDASANNVSKNIAPHIIRMAETRAKARALRDATNVAETAEEELGGDAGDEPIHAKPAQPRQADPANLDAARQRKEQGGKPARSPARAAYDDALNAYCDVSGASLHEAVSAATTATDAPRDSTAWSPDQAAAVTDWLLAQVHRAALKAPLARHTEVTGEKAKDVVLAAIAETGAPSDMARWSADDRTQIIGFINRDGETKRSKQALDQRRAEQDMPASGEMTF